MMSSSPRNMERLVDGRWVPAVPEPYWERSWFGWKLRCRCLARFSRREDYDDHYRANHLREPSDG